MPSLSGNANTYLLAFYHLQRTIGYFTRAQLYDTLSFTDEIIAVAEKELIDKGYLQLSSDGVEVNQQKSIPRLLQLWYHVKNWGGDLGNWISYHFTQLLYAAILFLLYLVLYPFLAKQINSLWVKAVMDDFVPTVPFDILLLICFAASSFIFRQRRPNTADFLCIILYFQQRFSATPWIWRSFYSKIGDVSFLYIDLIPTFYIIALLFSLIHYFIRSPYKANKKNNYLLPDTPITKSKEDKIGSSRFADQIATTLFSVLPRTHAYSIGICGSWGSGKTSLMSLVKERIEKTEKGDREFLVIQFTPWLFTDGEALISQFFAQLEKKFMTTDQLLAQEFRSYGKALAQIEQTFFISKITSLIEIPHKPLINRFEKIRLKLQQQRKFIVIFIDDLDRLNSKEVVEVLRLIRIVADFPNTFYLVSYDRFYVTSAVQKELSNYNSEKYLNKVINFELKLPELSPDIIKERLKSFITDQISSNNDLSSSIDKLQFQQCFVFDELSRYIQNERDIKRFTNILLVRYLFIRQEVNFYHFFLLELLNYHDHSAYQTIYDNRKQLMSHPDGISSFLSGLQPLMSHTYLIHQLASKPSELQLSFAHRLHFYNYFLLSIRQGAFSDHLFNNALGGTQEYMEQSLLEFYATNQELLANKLTIAVNSYPVKDIAEAEKILSALITLFVQVCNSKTSEQDPLSKWDMLIIFYRFLHSYQTLSEQSDLLRKVVSQHALWDQAATTTLISAPAVHLIRQQQLLPDFFPELFFTLQIELLQRKLNERKPAHICLAAIRTLHEFIQYDKNTSHVFSPHQFIERVVKLSASLLGNFALVTQYVSDFKRSNPDWAFADEQNVYKGLYDSPDGLAAVSEIVDTSYKNIRRILLGFQVTGLWEFRATHTTDGNSPNQALTEFNDYLVDQPFELLNKTVYKIELTPLSTYQWRFALRFHDSKKFSRTPSRRFDPKYKVLVFEKGERNDQQWVDRNPPQLLVSEYEGGKMVYQHVAIPSYDNDTLTILLNGANSADILLKDSSREEFELTPNPSQRIRLRDHFFQVLAWREFAEFSLNIKITCYRTEQSRYEIRDVD